ncbi:MAG: DUF3313 family protein [Bdellovibrionales bacterium]|nr:DUF3313 family protein [Bdellovibrionales bacterium]
MVIRTFGLVVFVSTLSGCGVLRATPAKDYGFLPKPELVSEQRTRAPFNGYWVFNPREYEEIREEYAKVYIDSIDTHIVEEMYRKASGKEETKIARIEEAQELGQYFRERLRIAMVERIQSGSNLKVVDKPGPGVLSLRIALVEVVPTNPGVNLIGTAAGFFVPGGGFLKSFGEGSIAMEGFVFEVDPMNSVFEEYKDREAQKYSAFTLKDYQRYAHLREVIDEWSVQIATLLTTPSSVTVEDSDLVSINPI